MTIDVLICTSGNGIRKAANVPGAPRPDVRYVVSLQGIAEAGDMPPALLKRTDVEVVTAAGKGLSANRNNAVAYAKGDIILFSDDDNLYSWDDFDRVLSAFNACPDADIICFRSAYYDGRLCRTFPSARFDLSRPPRGYYVRSCEIAVRRRKGYPAFDEHFGLGSEYLACGEEEIFIHDALRLGFRVVYCPLTIVRTDSDTTGSQFNVRASVRRSKGAVLAAIHGMVPAYLRVLKYASFHVSGMSRLTALRDMCKGIAYAKKVGRC